VTREQELERMLTDWLGEGPSRAPHAPVDAAVAHAIAHPRRAPWSERLRARLRLAGHRPASSTVPRASEAPGRILMLSTVRLASLGMIAALVSGLLFLQPRLDQAPTAIASPSPDASGLTGSLWADQSEFSWVYYLLHPDGSMVSLDSAYAPDLGMGVWTPTGERTLATTVAFLVAGGQATQRSEWDIDEAAETASMTYTLVTEATAGKPKAPESGTVTLTRLHLAPMPPDATYPTPPEPAWRNELGRPLYPLSDAGVAIEPYDPDNYDLSNADGTSLSLNAYVGTGLGLWAPTGEWSSVGTAWYPGWLHDPPAVAEAVGDPSGSFSARYGSSKAFEDTSSGQNMTLELAAGDGPLASPDPAALPVLARVWVEPADNGRASRIAWLADGTIVAVHARYGMGMGLWRPTTDGRIASTIVYLYDTWRQEATSTIGADGQSLQSDWVVTTQHDATGPTEEAGTSTSTLMQVEPMTPVSSPAP
jgi:hypothetical protein